MTGSKGAEGAEGGDPGRAALERAHRLMALFRQQQVVTEAELAAQGIHPVSVVHGYLETDADADLICGTLPRLADECGTVRSTIGGGDYTTYMFGGPDAEGAALAFMGRVLALNPPSWWRVTATATPAR
jgi:hypothetical protein